MVLYGKNVENEADFEVKVTRKAFWGQRGLDQAERATFGIADGSTQTLRLRW